LLLPLTMQTMVLPLISAEGAGGFYYDRVFVVEFQDGGADLAFIDEVHVVEHFAADAIGEFAYSFYGGAVDEAFDTV